MKGAASSSQREKKRKRAALPDTRVVDDPEAYRQKRAGSSAAQTSAQLAPDSSPAKAAKKPRSKSSEDEGKVVVTLPAEVTEGLLLAADRRRLSEIGPVKAAEWSLAHAYQVCRLRSLLCVFVLIYSLSVEMSCRL